jgi:hypothetical protein
MSVIHWMTASRHRRLPLTAMSNWSGFTDTGNHQRGVNRHRR